MDRSDQVILNSFATECFRDIADADYISARANYKLGLIHQFQWCALQAIEKYLKAILLYNQKKSKGLSHNLEKSLRRVESIDAFDLELEDYQRDLISHLNRNAQNRYLEQPTYTRGEELLQLDGTVWSLRRYCEAINFEASDGKGGTKNMLELKLNRITSDFYKKNPHKYIIIGGFLESVISRKKSDELRKVLIWKNFKYGKYRKNTVSNFIFRKIFHDPPHYRDTDRFELLSEYVDFPIRIKKTLAE